VADLVEVLADIEHERWSEWMRWLFVHGKWNKNGSFTINADKAQRWSRLAGLPYELLDNETQEWDRIEVRKTLKALREQGVKVEEFLK
jgi:hypothetical protein